MPNNPALTAANIRAWISADLTPQAIEAELLQKGFDENSILEHLQEFKKQRNTQKQFKGFVLMGLGGFLGFMSCVLTLTQVFPQWYDLILYGLTFIGVTLVMIGLYFVFE